MRMPQTTIACAIAALAALVAVPSARQQDVQLAFRGKPQLVDCGDRACFRMYVEALDANGQPVELPDQPKFEVTESGRALRVAPRKFRENAPAGSTTRTVVPRISLVLFDTSGSMKFKLPSGEARFDAAKNTLAQLAATLRDGVDQMAVAPFDSVEVVSRIANAEFQSTRAGVQAQIDRLKLGANTALYSAVFEGLKKLEARNVSGAQASLIVFTDGKNDVLTAPHDPGLLGDNELPKVIARAKEANVQVFAIGFGTPGQNFDENALRQIAFPNQMNYFGAADASRLNQIFTTIAARGKTFVRLLVAMPERREQLPRTIEFNVQTAALSATSPLWERPAMGEPPRANLTTDERPDVVLILDPAAGGVPAVVIRMIVLLTYAAVLAGMWFGLPRVIWPERYIPKPALQAAAARPGQRPAAGRVASHAVPGQRQQAPRPEVTLPANRAPMRPNPGGDRRSPPQPPPGRVREAPRAAQPPPEPLGPREAGDATVFIPPKKK